MHDKVHTIEMEPTTYLDVFLNKIVKKKPGGLAEVRFGKMRYHRDVDGVASSVSQLSHKRAQQCRSNVSVGPNVPPSAA